MQNNIDSAEVFGKDVHDRKMMEMNITYGIHNYQSENIKQDVEKKQLIESKENFEIFILVMSLDPYDCLVIK